MAFFDAKNTKNEIFLGVGDSQRVSSEYP